MGRRKKNHRFVEKWAFQTHLLACLPSPCSTSYCCLTIIIKKMCLARSQMRWSNTLSLSWGLTKGDSLSERKQCFQHCWRRDNLGAASFLWQSRSNSKRKMRERKKNTNDRHPRGSWRITAVTNYFKKTHELIVLQNKQEGLLHVVRRHAFKCMHLKEQ